MSKTLHKDLAAYVSLKIWLNAIGKPAGPSFKPVSAPHSFLWEKQALSAVLLIFAG